MKHAAIGAAIAAIGLASHATAAPVQWTGEAAATGHYYELVLGPTSWTDANDAATNSRFRGRNGHLVTITSGAEQAFVHSLNPLGLSTWIGLTDSVTEGIWQWVTGEVFDFSFWSGGQPDKGGLLLDEDYAMAFWGIGGRWNDCGNTTCLVTSYVVEYNVAPVPLPASVSLMGAALGLLGLMGWRRRRRSIA